MSRVNTARHMESPSTLSSAELPRHAAHTGAAGAAATAAPARGRSRLQARFRRPLAEVRISAARPLHRAFVFAAVPALALMTYVGSWTLAMRGGYHRDQLRQKIEALRVERADLEAERRRLQSPSLILTRAREELQMGPALHPEFSKLPSPQRVAKADSGTRQDR